jgi:hypothetical protein
MVRKLQTEILNTRYGLRGGGGRWSPCHVAVYISIERIQGPILTTAIIKNRLQNNYF